MDIRKPSGRSGQNKTSCSPGVHTRHLTCPVHHDHYTEYGIPGPSKCTMQGIMFNLSFLRKSDVLLTLRQIKVSNTNISTLRISPTKADDLAA